MEIKREENENAEYKENDINIQSDKKNTKKKKSLKKWGIVGTTLVVAGITGFAVYYQYQKTMTEWSGGLTVSDVALHNNQFVQFCGANRNRFVASELINVIIQHNLDVNSYDPISVSTSGTIKTINEGVLIDESFENEPVKEISELHNIRNKIDASRDCRFDIEIIKYDNNGYISEINIKS